MNIEYNRGGSNEDLSRVMSIRAHNDLSTGDCLPDPADCLATLSGEGVTHWALRPVEKPSLPEVDNKAWVKNPIDLFVLARLEEADLEPSPPASAGGGVKGGTRHGATDEYGFYAERGKVHIHDFHATLLYLLGIDHEKPTYRHGGRDFRLTDVFGNVVHDILN